MIRALVLSDIHALSRDLKACNGYAGSTGSKLYIEDRSLDKNSILAISSALKEYKGTIDFLICLGDLAHQAKQTVLMCVWSDIYRLAYQLEIDLVCAVTGNHDVASRPEDFKSAVPAHHLTLIHPSFPCSETLVSEEYNLRSYAKYEHDQLCLILIDTCTLHGYGGTDVSSIYRRGHLSGEIIEKIASTISSSPCIFYIVAMHHHPRRVIATDGDNDAIENGDLLLEKLTSTGKPGIILHGHKHVVSLSQTGSGLNQPWVLSASSLAANAYENMERYFSNQFHILEIERPLKSMGIRGKLFTWEWAANTWIKSDNHMMHHDVGFGASRSMFDIANDLETMVTTGFFSKNDVAKTIPDIDYLTMSQIEELHNLLGARSIDALYHQSSALSGFIRRGP